MTEQLRRTRKAYGRKRPSTAERNAKGTGRFYVAVFRDMTGRARLGLYTPTATGGYGKPIWHGPLDVPHAEAGLTAGLTDAVYRETGGKPPALVTWCAQSGQQFPALGRIMRAACRDLF